jgi:hypothetical protein
MPDIRASAEVKALIGAENLAELGKGAFASYRCPECGLAGRTTEATSVVARRYRKTVVVELAHARCTRSVLYDVDADPPPGLGLDGARADMRVLTLVMEYPDEPPVRPLLLLERRIESARFSPGGEKINVTLASLLGRGLEPMRSAGQLPPPPSAPAVRFIPCRDCCADDTPEPSMLQDLYVFFMLYEHLI